MEQRTIATEEDLFLYGQGERLKPKVPGIYAGHAAADHISPDPWRTGKRQTLRIGESTTVRRANGGRGARPHTGKGEGQGSVSREAILTGAASKVKTRRESDLVRNAQALMALDGRNRAAVRQLVTLECESFAGLTPRAQDIAADVLEAIS